MEQQGNKEEGNSKDNGTIATAPITTTTPQPTSSLNIDKGMQDLSLIIANNNNNNENNQRTSLNNSNRNSSSDIIPSSSPSVKASSMLPPLPPPPASAITAVAASTTTVSMSTIAKYFNNRVSPCPRINPGLIIK